MHKKYFDSQVFNEESEISETEALERDSYVVAYFRDNEPYYAEHVKEGNIQRVLHFVQHWPCEDILQKQISSNLEIPFEFILPPENIGAIEVRKYYFFNANGEFDFILEYHINTQGDLLLEVHKDESYNITGSTKYEYDDAGELLELIYKGIIKTE
jgi:hypothetical protein